MKHNIRHCLRFWTVLCALGFIAMNLANVAIGQDGTRSHRRLELPSNSPAAPQDQLARLLQYFQSLKGEPPKPPASDQPNDSTMSQLKQALGPELGGMLDKLPPNAVNDAMKDPEIRSRVKDMLQQFSKDGTVPDFIQKPSPRNNDSSSTRFRPNQPNAPNRDDQRPKSRDSQRPLPGGTDLGNNRPTPEGSRQDAQDRLKDLIEKLRDRQSGSASGTGQSTTQPDEASSKNVRRDQISDSNMGTDLQQTEPSAANPNTPMSESQWEQRLRDLMQKQRDSVRRNSENERSNRTRPNASNNQQTLGPRNERARSEPSTNNDQRPNGQRPTLESSSEQQALPGRSRNGRTNAASEQTKGPSRSTEAAPSFSEFLDQMQGVPAPDLSELGIDLSSAAPRNQKGSTGKMSGNLLEDAMKQMDPQQLREQAKKALQDQGLRSTLKDILKNAKQSAKQESTSGTGPGDLIANVAAATGMEDTVLEALGGMTEELVEIAKDAKFQDGAPNGTSADQQFGNSASNNDSASSSSATAKPKNSQQAAEDKSVFSQLTESASNAIKNFATSPETTAGGSANPDLIPELGRGSLSAVMIAGLIIAALVACLFVGKKLLPTTEAETSEQVLATLLKQGIRSREDVIKAFHQFALKPPHETENWWTHSRVVETVVQQYPQHSARIQILATLYEQARYFPADTEFTDAQIQQAADAVRTVGVA